MTSQLNLNKYQDTLPFHLVNNLKVPLYIEESFKIKSGSLIDHRYLVGVYKKHIDETTMVTICREMNMPDDFLEIFIQSQAHAGGFGIGYQETASQRIYKIYLDFFDKVMIQARFMPTSNRPLKMNVGFKWDPERPNNKLISTYNCYPIITVPEIRKRMKHLYANSKDKNPLAAAIEILDLANSKVKGDDLFIYLEVNEKNTLRKSFDINLLQANLPVGEISSILVQPLKYFSISSTQFKDLFQKNESKTVGHLSGGIDLDGKEFLTVYYKLS